MAAYNDSQITEMRALLESLDTKKQILLERLIDYHFRTEIAREYANQGVAIRLMGIIYSTCRVFEVLPPEMSEIPTSAQRSEATAHIQAVAFNVYGCFDNLAQIWVSELGIQKPNGQQLGRNEIGFAKKCKTVRSSLPQTLQSTLCELDPWLKHLEDFRQATAHRIPLYIPPFMVSPTKYPLYKDLNTGAYEALARHDFVEFETLIEARNALRHFLPMIATSINDPTNAMFHPQLLADFQTVEKWISLILDHLPTMQV